MRQAAQQEKEAIQEKLDKECANIQKEKQQLLKKQIRLEEAVKITFFAMVGLEHKVE